MSKVWLVFQREYITRVRKKSFILITLLTPLAILLFMVIAGFIFSYQSDDRKQVVIHDRTDLFEQEVPELRRFAFSFSEAPLDSLRSAVVRGEYAGLIEIGQLDSSDQQYVYNYHSDEPLDIESSALLDREIKSRIRIIRMKQLDLDEDLLGMLEVKVRSRHKAVSEKGKNITSFTGYIAAAIGGVMGYIMFFMIILFGTQVMRSVSEEKVNRIVEVIISSVKPFELMLGKILGSSAVSLTQILIWLLIVPISSIMIKIFIPSDSESISEIAASGQIPDGLDQIPFVIEQIGNMNWWLILPLFIFYFITGFLIYAAMFAAIGAAIGDDINDSQTLTMPVVIPIVLAVYIMFQVVREPHSTLAVWSSIFPFFSSIIMPTRLPYQPEYWQIILSVVTTLGTAILMIWLAGRIYRIGIMMYGKKASFKDLFKWLFKKEL
jgi:ABC-2 type transport system permease protein